MDDSIGKEFSMSIQKSKKPSIDMTVGNPIRLMVLFAIPMWIGGVFQLMYNMVDTIVVGRFVSTDALAAIGATSSTTASAAAHVSTTATAPTPATLTTTCSGWKPCGATLWWGMRPR